MAKIFTAKCNLKAQKSIHQTIFEILKYLQQCFETAYLIENAINLLQPKVAQNVTISLGNFIFSKNHIEPLKVAQLMKNCPVAPTILSKGRHGLGSYPQTSDYAGKTCQGETLQFITNIRKLRDQLSSGPNVIKLLRP